MEHCVKEVLKKIEELRDELGRLYDKKDISDPEIIEKSQELDKKLNIYNKIHNNK